MAISSASDQPQGDEYSGGDADIDDGDAPVVGERDGEHDQGNRRGGRERNIDFARQTRLRRHHVAEQRANRHVMGAAEWPKRKGERRYQPVDQRKHEFAWMHRRLDRQRDDPTESPGNQKRQQRAQRHADAAADGRQHQHLREIDREYAFAGSAERLQGGDGLAPAVEMAFHRVADADAADQKRGQADDGEKLGEAVDVALELRQSIRAAADFPAGFGKLGARLRGDRLGSRVATVVLGQPQAIMPTHETAGLQQSGGAQGVLVHQQPRPEADAAGELVRLARERGADFDDGAADGEPCAGLDAEPR